MRIYVVEKPATAQQLAPQIAAKWPEEAMMFLAIASVNLTNFTSPRSLPYKSYPVVTEPVFKPNLNRWSTREGNGCFVIGYTQSNGKLSERIKLTIDEVKALLIKADSIVCATDWDAAGMWGFDFLLKQCSPEKYSLEHKVLKLDAGFDARSIKRYMKTPLSTRDESYLQMLNAGRVKRYFDYNFNTNSLVIFGKLYREITDNKDPFFVSKYMLQAFLYLAKQSTIKHSSMEFILHEWNGSGKYARDSTIHTMGMGTAASRGLIVRNLVDIGLVTEDEHNLKISEIGILFASLLHKDCSDPDLPFRIDAWMRMPFEDAKTRIDTYLNRFFGKQKRYINTQA